MKPEAVQTIAATRLSVNILGRLLLRRSSEEAKRQGGICAPFLTVGNTAFATDRAKEPIPFNNHISVVAKVI